MGLAEHVLSSVVCAPVMGLLGTLWFTHPWCHYLYLFMFDVTLCVRVFQT